MNKDQARGTAKITVGKIQREVGKLVGSRKEQVKGIEKEIEGGLQQRLGDAKEAIGSSRKADRRAERPRAARP